MCERDVRASEIAELLAEGEIIDYNKKATPLPTCRISYTILNSRTLCAVVAYNGHLKQAHVITVYWQE